MVACSEEEMLHRNQRNEVLTSVLFAKVDYLLSFFIGNFQGRYGFPDAETPGEYIISDLGGADGQNRPAMKSKVGIWMRR